MKPKQWFIVDLGRRSLRMPGQEKVLEDVTLRAHAVRFAGLTKILTLLAHGSLV